MKITKSIRSTKTYKSKNFCQNPRRNFRSYLTNIVFILLSSTFCFGQSNKELKLIVRNQDTLKLSHLIEDGFDINTTYRDLDRDDCLLNRAIWFKKRELTNFLLSQPNIQIHRVDRDKRNTLHMLARNGWYDLAEKLIESGVELNTLGRKDSHILRLILWENGARLVESKSLKPSLEFIRYLYSKDLKPELSIDCCRKKTTILIFGVMSSDLATTEFLLSQDEESINMVDHKGKSALHWAIQLNKKDIVIFLIENGANVNLKDNRGKLSLEYAIKSEDVKMIELIKKASNNM